MLLGRDLDDYLDRFEALLGRADLLWTKPSELVFYAALGLPLVCAPPVGVHERYNRRWVTEAGAGLRQGDPSFAWQWISHWLEDGTLAAAAWSGFQRLPKFGAYRILEAVGAPPGASGVAGFAGGLRSEGHVPSRLPGTAGLRTARRGRMTPIKWSR